MKNVEAQFTELVTGYGEMFEIWFDGGVIPPEKGGPDLTPIIRKYQPYAVCFQGPKDWPHDLRWVGNEDGLAPENCWATTNAGEARYDGTEPDEQAGVGDPDGKHYWPAETDTPNRSTSAFGGGWAWKAGEEHLVRTPEDLLDSYVRSVGRNSNLLIGMAIGTDGRFQDEDQFRAFGDLLRRTFGTPKALFESPSLADGKCVLTLPEQLDIGYIVLREDITRGQSIRGFEVRADGRTILRSECVGHKRIISVKGLSAKEITILITVSVGEASLRDVTLY